MNPFHYQSDFVTRDPSFNFKTESDVILCSSENMYERFWHWIQPKELAGLSILDIGSKISSACGYVLYNGSTRYLGIEKDPCLVKIAKENIQKYYSTADAVVRCMSAEDFIETNGEAFDIAFLGRVLFQIDDAVHFLKKLSKIANTIIIEDVHPLHMPTVYLIDKLDYKKTDLTDLLCNLEYNYSIAESYSLDLFDQLKKYPYTKDNTPHCSTVYSIGYLKELFKSLGFTCDLSSYENIKKIFPSEYGYGLYKNRDGVKKFIIRFDRIV